MQELVLAALAHTATVVSMLRGVFATGVNMQHNQTRLP